MESRSRLSFLLMTGSVSALIFVGTPAIAGMKAGETVAYDFGGKILRFALPPGYCPLDQGVAVEGRQSHQPDSGAQPLAIFAACREFSRWQKGEIGGFSDFGLLLVSSEDASKTASGECDRERFVDFMVRVINRDTREETTRAIRADVRRELEALGVGEIMWTGVLDHDDKAAYAGFVGMGNTRRISLAGISAVTLVDGLPVSLIMLNPIADNRSFPRLLAMQKANIRQLVAQNAQGGCEGDDIALGGGLIDRPTWYDHQGWADLGPHTLFVLACGLLLAGLAFWLRGEA